MMVLIAGAGSYFISNRTYVYKGSSYYPFPQAYNFQLTDPHGKRFELADNLGKVVLLFFGYTNCPDVCPITLANYAQIREKLGERADQVVFVFITEDPERDTRERVKEYLSAFDRAIIGLTGTMEELQPVWEAYYVAREIEPAAELEDKYTVAHGSRIYVIDRAGRLRLTFPYGMEINDMLQDILHLVSESGS
jgi:protein SCO1